MMYRQTAETDTQSRKRRGASLLETSLAVTVAGAMLGLAVYAMHLLMHAERQLKTADWQAESLIRLSTLYRRDAHSALSVQLKEPNQGSSTTVIFTQPDRRSVVYASTEERIARTVESSNAVQHRDAFVLPNGASASFENDQKTRVSTILIHTRSRPEDSSKEDPVSITPEFQPNRSVRIEAVVARDHRFHTQN
jgi:hypothetical protein